jgi:hypothetical protein
LFDFGQRIFDWFNELFVAGDSADDGDIGCDNVSLYPGRVAINLGASGGRVDAVAADYRELAKVLFEVCDA